MRACTAISIEGATIPRMRPFFKGDLESAVSMYPIMDAQTFLIPLYSTLLLAAIFIVVGLVLGFLARAIDALLSLPLGSAVYSAYGTIFLPGILMHELAHALFLALTGAQVTEIVVREDSRHPWALYRDRRAYPSGSYGANRAGHVAYRRRGPFVLQSLQRVLGACAPTVVGLACLIGLINLLMNGCSVWWQYAICIYLLVCVLNGATLSTADIRDMAPGLPVVLLALYVVFLATGFDATALVPADVTRWAAAVAGNLNVAR